MEPLKPKCVLELRPLIAFRDYHSTTHQNDALNPALDIAGGLVSITAYPGLPPLYFAHNAQELVSDGQVVSAISNIASNASAAWTSRKTCFSPSRCCFRSDNGDAAAVIASTQPHDADSVAVCANASAAAAKPSSTRPRQISRWCGL